MNYSMKYNTKHNTKGNAKSNAKSNAKGCAKKNAVNVLRSVLFVTLGSTSFVLNAEAVVNSDIESSGSVGSAEIQSAQKAANGSESVAHQNMHQGMYQENAQTKLKALLNNMQQFRAAFSQTVVDAQQNVVHEAEGVLTMTRPNKLRWETTFPDETLLIADGEAVWNVDTFVEQVTILSQDNAIKDNPIMLLTSNDEDTWSMFSISQLDDALASMSNNTTAANLKSFQITPKSQDGQILTLTMTFNSSDALAALTMLDAQQQLSTLIFSDIETKFPLAADTFEVDVPESFIIDDQR
ncbi:outer membrane lipoprotein chaperone LolA [Alteromonas sp. RW2A1]|uniref:outer membrane lipoprotein chaperone LolA n=1 Tax=Alteromonas sp. RW2A1 TaxID=1917158 RepID=UPI000AD79692|nr:outer membrane lipoprotein chaperone LolA [Alteromonas sp. RW2A1]